MGATYKDFDNLSSADADLERARQSLIEELEAINWYQQRIASTKSAELKKILEHNRGEEKEHAAMLIDFLRENDPTFDKMFAEHD